MFFSKNSRIEKSNNFNEQSTRGLNIKYELTEEKKKNKNSEPKDKLIEIIKSEGQKKCREKDE